MSKDEKYKFLNWNSVGVVSEINTLLVTKLTQTKVKILQNTYHFFLYVKFYTFVEFLLDEGKSNFWVTFALEIRRKGLKNMEVF